MLAKLQAIVDALSALAAAVADIPALETALTDFDTFLTNLG
jgi:hypothetical protein